MKKKLVNKGNLENCSVSIKFKEENKRNRRMVLFYFISRKGS